MGNPYRRGLLSKYLLGFAIKLRAAREIADRHNNALSVVGFWQERTHATNEQVLMAINTRQKLRTHKVGFAFSTQGAVENLKIVVSW